MLTTGDVAHHCDVSSETAASWVRAGKLKAYTTPGRHRRIRVEDFKAFLEEYDLPPFEEESASRPRVLVVDDEPPVVDLIVGFLSLTGDYEVATAADGFAAGIKVATFHPELILLDLVMPYVDGFDLMRQLKSDPETSHIMVLVVTGFMGDGNAEKARSCGADAMIAKPFGPDELKEKVDQLFAVGARDCDQDPVPD